MIKRLRRGYARACCEVIGLSASTLRRWRPTDHDTVIEDGRPLADRPPPANRYSQSEHDRILELCNRPEYASLPPSQIVPILADEKTYIGSESTIYRALKQAGLLNHRGRAKARTARAAPTTHLADAPNQVWMMDVTCLLYTSPSPRDRQKSRMPSSA